ncbi:carboxypeptidase-like regulatory domain-containing protein [Polaribacter porphyrae]|uniref:Carboxypeptidase-like regulatory domain-containing protein n=1 Tax=Polaribacter porphyrae TaxID=1137780 RepID=A0A2S7WMN1_9FLAO|nr:carboxypeptidase-like regulatory domain-containing protein [Polaribacter porphyrae]PQJ78839.1 hypothetical protein BTO18_06415 [Polaribacter porphyrae]
MKKITTLLFICLSTFVLSQSKEFTVLDASTKKPIDLAQILYPALEIGSVTNSDGKIKIPLRKNKIVVSHINYQEKEFLYSDFIKKDTLYLTPNTNELDEIVVYNVNLLKKVVNVLENTYLKEYSTKKAIHNSTYKETFSINDSLSRLFQVQLNWWSKNSLFKGNKAIDKQNKIHLESVDYSKINKINKNQISSNGAYVENRIFFQFAHLNFLLSMFKDLAYDVEINSIEKNETSNKVYFDAVFRQKGKLVFTHKNSLLVFDNEYKHVKHLKFNMMYDEDFEDDISETSKIPYKKKMTKHTLELSFKNLKNNKLSLSYYISEIHAVLKTKQFTDKVVSKQSLFIGESNFGKKLRKDVINFYQPFFKNIESDQKNTDVKILLTEKETKFLESKS